MHRGTQGSQTRARGTLFKKPERRLKRAPLEHGLGVTSKNNPDLEKLLNFVRFHVRNSIADNSSMKLASNVLETSVRVLEHTLMLRPPQPQAARRRG